MRSPACLLLCLAACVHPGAGLRNRAATEAALEQAPLPADRLKRQAMLQHMVRSGLWTLLENGKQLAPIIFGTGPDSIVHIVAREEGKPGCVESDGLLAKAAAAAWEAKLEKWETEAVEEMMPVLSNMTMGPEGPSLADMWKAQKLAKKVSKSLMREVPGACKNALVGAGGDGWSGMVSCMHQATNVSKRCVRCVPRFFKQMSAECAGNCERSLYNAADELADRLEPMISKVMGGGLNDQGQLDEVATNLFGTFKALVPCLQCARAKADSLMGCFNMADSAWQQDVDAAIQGLIDDLESGNITATIQPMGQPAQPAQPPVPLA